MFFTSCGKLEQTPLRDGCDVEQPAVGSRLMAELCRRGLIWRLVGRCRPPALLLTSFLDHQPATEAHRTNFDLTGHRTVVCATSIPCHRLVPPPPWVPSRSHSVLCPVWCRLSPVSRLDHTPSCVPYGVASVLCPVWCPLRPVSPLVPFRPVSCLVPSPSCVLSV